MKAYLPLHKVVEDPVPSTKRAKMDTSNVYVFPLSGLLDRVLRSPRIIKQIEVHSAGHIPRGQEGRDNQLTADHDFSVATRGTADRKECGMNGEHSRGCSLYTVY